MHISGKTLLVTGANRGIGEALVKEALNRRAKRVFAGTWSTIPNTDPRVTALTLEFHGFVQWRIVEGKFAERSATVTPLAELSEGINVW
jgi:NAD(P)-dependent dehydrogenase (short-subunit alcohol dehydrogenase family)